jgi:WXG100 family type VII secretion target
MSTIRMSYPEMCAAAGDIIRCAERARTALQRLHGAAAALDSHWTGRARSAFDQDFAACLAEAAHFPRMLDQVGAALNKTAETVRAGEQQAREAVEATVTSDGGAQ